MLHALVGNLWNTLWHLQPWKEQQLLILGLSVPALKAGEEKGCLMRRLFLNVLLDDRLSNNNSQKSAKIMQEEVSHMCILQYRKM